MSINATFGSKYSTDLFSVIKTVLYQYTNSQTVDINARIELYKDKQVYFEYIMIVYL
jgi:hypothetical protein